VPDISYIKSLYHEGGWPLEQKYISIIKPNGGENWVFGNQEEITWIDNIDTNVRTDLPDSDQYRILISMIDSLNLFGSESVIFTFDDAHGHYGAEGLVEHGAFFSSVS